MVLHLRTLLDSLDGLLLHNILSRVFVAERPVKWQVSNGVTGGHQMFEIDILKERLDPATPFYLLGRHFASDWSWVSFNTCNESMLIRPVRCSFIISLQDNSLLAGMPTSQKNDHTALFVYLHHCGF